MKLKVPQLFSQRDSRWASQLLGYNTSSQYNIGMYGCLITCFGMYVDKTPEYVNKLLKDNNGYQAGTGNFIWSKSTVLGLTQTYVSPYYDGPVSTQGIAKLRELLDQGLPLICEIDFNPATQGEEMHFVLVMGYEGEDVFINDPWTGETLNLAVYGGPQRAIIQFRAYDRVLQTNTAQTVIVPSDVFENLVKKSTIYDKICQKLKTTNETLIFTELERFEKLDQAVIDKDRDLTEANSKIVDLSNQLEELRSQHVVLTDENEKLEGKLKKQTEEITQQGSQLKQLSQEIDKLKAETPLSSYTGIQLIIKGIQKLFS